MYKRYRLGSKMFPTCVTGVAPYVVHRWPLTFCFAGAGDIRPRLYSLVKQHFTIPWTTDRPTDRPILIIDFHLLNCGMRVWERPHRGGEEDSSSFCSSGVEKRRRRRRWKPTDYKPKQQQQYHHHITKNHRFFLCVCVLRSTDTQDTQMGTFRW